MCDSNLAGFLNILEGCRHHPVEHLIYASSSSVYGANQHTPYSVQDDVDHPLSLYAATKKANELMAHSYSHLFGIPCTGLRFFTVYGPWGRPDMSPIQFAQAIVEGRPLKLFNHGEHQRDFTYIDDIIESLTRLIDAATAGPIRTGTANSPTRPPAWRRGGSTTSAASTRSNSRTTSHCWKNIWAQGPASNCCLCNPGDVLNTCADVSRTGTGHRLPAPDRAGRRTRPLRFLVPRLLHRSCAARIAAHGRSAAEECHDPETRKKLCQIAQYASGKNASTPSIACASDAAIHRQGRGWLSGRDGGRPWTLSRTNRVRGLPRRPADPAC